METTIKLAATFGMLIALTACSDNPCDKYSSHNGEKDYCINNKASKVSISYLDKGASPVPHKEWLTMENAKKVLAFKKEYL